jgi:hypothetical protein
MSGAEHRAERLGWLDLARVLCALLILGIHWLRAGYKVGLFGHGSATSLVMDYQSHSGGLRLFQYVLIAGTGHAVSTWLTNLIGLLGGFGWEAVSALIVISGFSLVVAQGHKSLTPGDWVTWYGKRAKRILVPFYLVAATFLILYALATVALPHLNAHVATVINAKLLSQFHTPPLGVIISHIFLFDPYNRSWSADFFAPAWWFVPAILLAYVAYPFARSASTYRKGVPLLIGAALLSMAAFVASDAGILVNETWYYIVLHESFNFCLGIVIGGVWLGARRPILERALADWRVVGAAFAVFVLGNIVNWSPGFRPIASMMYGPSLVVLLVFFAKLLERSRIAPAFTSVDPYDLYLVHQPFAFPIALVAGTLFHSYAVFVGWFIFVAVASAAAKVLSVAQRPFFAGRPGVRGETGESPVFTLSQKGAGS